MAELLFELVFQLFGELLLEAVFRGGRFVVRRTGRLLGFAWAVGPAQVPPRVTAATMAVLGAALGLAGGWWWGDRQADRQLDHVPYLLFSSATVALLAAVALLPPVRGRLSERSGSRGVRAYLLDRRRLVFFAAANSAIAAGVTLGWW